MPKRKPADRVTSGFAYKTFQLLQDATIASVVAWDDSGSSFEVKDVTGFSRAVLPKYFKHSNFASFVRQLNMYGFRKKPERYAFSHPLFTRDAPQKVKKMRRKLTEEVKMDEDSGNLREIMGKVYQLQRCQSDLQQQIASLRDSNKAFKEASLAMAEEIQRFQARFRRIDEVMGLLGFLPEGESPVSVSLTMQPEILAIAEDPALIDESQSSTRPSAVPA